MSRNLIWGTAVVVGLVALGWPISPRSGWAQEQEVVFSQVTVSGNEASLRLELTSGEEISAEISDGEMLLNDQIVGEYGAGDGIEGSWRALLAQAISSDPADLPALLAAWNLPEGLGPEVREGAEILRARLTGAFEARQANPATVPVQDPSPGTLSALEALLQRSDRLRELATAIDDLASLDVTIRLGEDVQIREGETVEGSLLVVDGNLRLEGTVEGDVILLGGRLELGEEGRIDGTLRIADAQIFGDRERITGGVAEIVEEVEAVVSTNTREVEEVVRDAVREATADARRSSRNGAFGSRSSPFRSLGRGVAGLFQVLVSFMIVFGAGLGALYFFPRRLEVVSQAARGTAGRSFFVGLAGLVLVVPVWIVGIVLLAISIIGIPLLLVWIPAVPLALAVAILFGYLSVARNLGGWLSSRDLRGFEGIDKTRPAVQVGSGLAILLAAFALAHVFQMGGSLFGVFNGLLMFVGIVGTLIAASIGLGAVILSRAGRDLDFANRMWRSGSGDSRGDDAAAPA